MPPIRLGEGLAFPKDVLSAKHKGHPEEKRMGGIPFSLKLEGQEWQCIFHAFPQGAGRHGFSCPNCTAAVAVVFTLLYNKFG